MNHAFSWTGRWIGFLLDMSSARAIAGPSRRATLCYLVVVILIRMGLVDHETAQSLIVAKVQMPVQQLMTIVHFFKWWLILSRPYRMESDEIGSSGCKRPAKNL